MPTMTTCSASDVRSRIRGTFRRYFVSMYTPFSPSGDIDQVALRRNVETTLGLPGVGGISLHTIHQEFWTLTDAERRQVTEVVLEQVDGRVPVIVGVSDTCAQTVTDLARHAEEWGAAALMIWPPFYGQRSADGVRAFYEQVAQRLRIGFFAYSTTLAELGFYLTPDIAEKLLSIDNLVGIQSTTNSISGFSAMMERVGDRICVATSLEEYFLYGRTTFPERSPHFLMGASRPLLVQSHEQPHCGDFINAVMREDIAQATVLARRIVAIADTVQSRYFAAGFHHVALSKALSEHNRLVGGPPRPPASPPSTQELRECREALAAAGLGR